MTKYSVLSLLLGILLTSCATTNLSRQTVAEPAKLPGSFTAILIGGTFAADAERVAIFDLEGDKYHFEPVTPPYRVKRLEGLSAAAALDEAVKLFSSHCAYNGYRVKSLRLADGTLVGYEVTPDLPPALCEWGNVVTVSYKVYGDGEIKVYTNLLLPTEEDTSHKGGELRNPRP